MAKNNDKDFWSMWRIPLLIAVLAVLVCILCSSCEFFRKLDKSKTEVRGDSTNVKKEAEGLNKVDTSKSKTETASTKETVYYPQPIIIKGDDGKSYPVFVPQIVKETGSSKEEKQNFNYDQWFKEKTDSITIAQLRLELDKKSETKGSVLGMGFWIGVSILGVVLLGIVIVLAKFANQIKNVTSFINNK